MTLADAKSREEAAKAAARKAAEKVEEARRQAAWVREEKRKAELLKDEVRLEEAALRRQLQTEQEELDKLKRALEEELAEPEKQREAKQLSEREPVSAAKRHSAGTRQRAESEEKKAQHLRKLEEELEKEAENQANRPKKGFKERRNSLLQKAGSKASSALKTLQGSLKRKKNRASQELDNGPEDSTQPNPENHSNEDQLGQGQGNAPRMHGGAGGAHQRRASSTRYSAKRDSKLSMGGPPPLAPSQAFQKSLSPSNASRNAQHQGPLPSAPVSPPSRTITSGLTLESCGDSAEAGREHGSGASLQGSHIPPSSPGPLRTGEANTRRGKRLSNDTRSSPPPPLSLESSSSTSQSPKNSPKQYLPPHSPLHSPVVKTGVAPGVRHFRDTHREGIENTPNAAKALASNTPVSSPRKRSVYKADPVRVTCSVTEKEAQDWIESVVGISFTKSFGEELRDGVLLCKLLNTISPGTCREPYVGAVQFRQLENVTTFIQAARRIGVTESDLFPTASLFDRGETAQVAVTLLALRRLTNGKSNRRSSTNKEQTASAGKTKSLGENLKPSWRPANTVSGSFVTSPKRASNSSVASRQSTFSQASLRKTTTNQASSSSPPCRPSSQASLRTTPGSATSPVNSPVPPRVYHGSKPKQDTLKRGTFSVYNQETEKGDVGNKATIVSTPGLLRFLSSA